jgi:hypothetical protein
MGISPKKSEIITFLGRDPERCKITVGNKCLPQVKNFKYLTCEISYENENLYIKKIPGKFDQIPGILNSTFKPTSRNLQE